MQDCPEPASPAKPVLNADLARYAKAVRASLRECNADKAALRQWAELKDK